MPDATPSTELTSQYTAQVIGDLDRNVKEQERIGAEIDALQEQLNALRHDHAVLTSLHQALGGADTAVPAPPAPTGVASVPQQKGSAKAAGPTASAKSGKAPKSTDAKRPRSRAKTAGTAKSVQAKAATTTSEVKSTGGAEPAGADAKSTATKNTATTGTATKSTATKDAAAKSTGAKTPDTKLAATKTAAAKPASAKSAPAKKPAAKAGSGRPTLVELIRGYLTDQGEPRSAAEVSTALGKSHPDRRIQTNVVRTTLENLVAKSHAHRAKQGTSVFYTATDALRPAAAAPATEQPVEASAG
ncbi:hypothetical protein AB0912_33330 [Streptomyces sp. NPDC007084]|uniref:hypothetical protein n=1 Tax=Streptomyces sp. NPDC007084 TaxID=3154313 RepID=UPI0034521233